MQKGNVASCASHEKITSRKRNEDDTLVLVNEKREKKRRKIGGDEMAHVSQNIYMHYKHK